MVKNHLKIIRSRSGFGPSPKFNQFFLITLPMSTKFRSNPSTTFWDIMLYIVFGPISQWWRITWKILKSRTASGFRSPPKSNQLVLLTHPTCPQNCIQIRLQLFEISCTQTNKQTERCENITSFTFCGGGNNNNQRVHRNTSPSQFWQIWLVEMM